MTPNHYSLLLVTLFYINSVQSDFDCSNRRCCLFKSPSNKAKSSIDCTDLSLTHCIDNRDICDWDCTPIHSQQTKASLSRAGYTKKSFKRISKGDGQYNEPHIDGPPNSPHGEPQTVDQVIEYTRISTVDECGVVYEYEMDTASANNELNKINSNRGGKSNNKAPKSAASKHDTNNGNALNEGLVDKLIRRLTVFGNDGRVRIQSQNQMKFTGYLQFSTLNGLEKRCTATLIAANWIITAAHCIHSGNGPFYSEWFHDWRFYPGLTDEGQMSNLELHGLQAWTFSEWTNDYGPNWDYDIGWIELNTVDAGITPLSIGWDDSLQDGELMNTVGYPGDMPWLTKWHQLCSWNYVIQEFMVSDSCDIAPGSSGSPVYKYSTGRYRREILCIVSWENDYFNGCARITQSKYDVICSFIGCI